MILTQVKKFIAKLQAANETTRKRWLIFLTSGTMALVIGLWAVYINFSTESVSPTAPAISQPERPGAWQIFSAGLTIISDNLAAAGWQAKNYLKENILKTKWIIIENPGLDFTPPDLEPIPITPLP